MKRKFVTMALSLLWFALSLSVAYAHTHGRNFTPKVFLSWEAKVVLQVDDVYAIQYNNPDKNSPFQNVIAVTRRISLFENGQLGEEHILTYKYDCFGLRRTFQRNGKEFIELQRKKIQDR